MGEQQEMVLRPTQITANQNNRDEFVLVIGMGRAWLSYHDKIQR